MPRYVALLRGINVGGRTKVPMAELREIATSLDWQDVSTHLNSGNLFFTTDVESNEEALGAQLTAEIRSRLDLSPPTLVRTQSELERSARFCRESFPDKPDKLVAIAYLSATPNKDIDVLLADELEEHRAHERSVALYYPNGQGRSRLDTARLERLLGVTVTVRGIQTVEALIKRFG